MDTMTNLLGPALCRGWKISLALAPLLPFAKATERFKVPTKQRD